MPELQIEERELDLTMTTKTDLDSNTPTASAASSENNHQLSSSMDSLCQSVTIDVPRNGVTQKKRVSINDILEKDMDNALKLSDIQEQVRASIASIPIEDMPQLESIEVSRKESGWFTHLHSLFQSKKRDRNFKLYEMYKYANRYDWLLIIIGTISAIIAGICYPLMYIVYQRSLDIFSNYYGPESNLTANSTLPCAEEVNRTAIVSPSHEMKVFINYYVILGFASFVFTWIGWVTWAIAAERQVRRIRFRLFRNILQQNVGWFDVQKANELPNRLSDDLEKLKDGLGEKVADFIATTARIIGSLVYSFAVGWKITLVFLSMSPLIVFALNITIKMIVSFTIKEVQAFASASAVAQEVLQNIRTVTAFHGQKKEEQRFADSLINVKKAGVQKGIVIGLCQMVNSILNYTSFAIIVWYGPYLVRTDCANNSAGSVVAIFLACTTVIKCISQLILNIESFAEAAGCAVKVFDLIEQETAIDAFSDQGEKPEKITGDIEFRNVVFTYPARDETTILNKLSLRIPAGKTVALVGSSGSGKSTIVQLIQRFYDPENGQVLLDGKDIKTLNVSWLRSHIGIVSQEPVLFTGSIEDNIRMGKNDATDEEVQHVAKMANAHDFIMGLPENYKTASGDKLSGGQKQRVAIARALIRNPKILLLDEATSALDNASEQVVQKAIDRAKEGRTTIIIAHRLSTIQHADIIIALDHGQVVEYGNHSELMANKGLYYELLSSQGQKNENEDNDQSDEEEEEEEEVVVVEKKKEDANKGLRISLAVDRKFSKISIYSNNNSDIVENDINSPISIEITKKKRWFRTPFIFKIFKYNAPEWLWIVLGAIAALGYGASSPVFGLIFADMYAVFNVPDLDEQARISRKYAIVSFFLGVASGLTQFLTSLCFAKSGEALTMRMRKLAFSAMLRQEISYFDEESNSTGALVTRLSSDASATKGLTGTRLDVIFQTISAIILGLVLGFLASWQITLVILCFFPVLIISMKTRAKRKRKDNVNFSELGARHAVQAIEHIRTVIALQQETRFAELYEEAFNQDFKKQIRLAYLIAFGSALSSTISYFFRCAAFGYGNKLVEEGTIKYTDMYRVFSVVTKTMFTVSRCIAVVPDYSKGKNAALRLMKLHNRESRIDPNDESGYTLDHVVGDVEFRDISFRYPNRPTLRIFRRFSLKCLHNQTTALAGPSGGGKSTTIALLQRFYDPVRGKVLLDGHDVRDLNIRWLRSLMGLVQQEPILFNLSIRENIAYGDNSREVTQTEIENAAKMVNIHDLIVSLPEGYDTLCGAKGNQLSGGQKQRIAIARALIRDPKILLLDEATSALDNKSEKVVQATLNEAKKGRTCLTIAHRLTTIQNSEKIAVINRGKMIEEGTHAELLQQNGIYAKLATAQQKH